MTKANRVNLEKDLIARTTETIYDAMKRNEVTKAELARRIGKTNAYVTQILSGERNLTLRTIAAVAAALNMRPRVTLTDADRAETGRR